MTRRRILAGALALLPVAAFGEARTTGTRRRPARSARRQPQAMAPPPPAPPPIPRDDPAPVPNRDLEAPRDSTANAGEPRFGPVLIDPHTPRVGATSDPHSPQAREDRFLRQPGAGGRLTVPFSY